MNPIAPIISNYKLMILDGGQATELERLGCDLNDHLWSARILIDAPDQIKAVSRSYLNAGADGIATATYQATYPGFKKLGLSESQITALFADAIKLACESRDEFWHEQDEYTRKSRPKPLVAGSIGCYGAYLADGSEYTGDYEVSDDELFAFHYQRMKTMVEVSTEAHHIDIFAFETIPSFNEARILMEVLKNFPGKYAWLSFSIRDESYVSKGDLLDASAIYLENYDQLAAVGVNCTGPGNVAPAITTLNKVTSLPVIVYPNSGESFNADKKDWTGGADNTAGFYELSNLWYARGARIIGGCCRTSPEDIREIAKFRKNLFKRSM